MQKLTTFIDAFNFYPMRVNQIHYKNSSDKLTQIITGDKDFASRAEKNKEFEKSWTTNIGGFKEEKRIFKLLSLVSSKISERFRNLREAFRFIDTDHSSSISINEFA